MKTLRSVPLLLAATFTFSFAIAQVAPPPSPTLPPPAPPASPAGSEEIVRLPAFEVSTAQDTGYQAVNTLAGGRTNTPLRLTPAAISALTAEFLEDLSLTSIRDAFFWTINAAPGNLRQQETIFGDYSYNIRGVGEGTTVPTRNYFHFYAASDTYNTERFEFARGPNSIIYGDAQLGGQPTTFTKVPRVDRDFRLLRFQVDSYGGIRGTFDVNERSSEKLATRVNGLIQRGRDWRDGIDLDKEAIHVAVRYRFSDRTELRAETEWSKERRLTYAINYFDQSSFWDGTTSYAGGAAIPPEDRVRAGVALMGGSPYYVVIPAVPEAGFSNWQNFYWTSGTGVALLDAPRGDIPGSPVLPSREFTLQPPDGLAFERYNATTVWLDHRFSDRLEAQLSYYYFDDSREARTTELFNTHRIDVNRVLPNGLANPKFGVPFSDATVGRQVQERTVNEIRGLASLRLESNRANLDLKQRFTVAGGRRWFHYDLVSYYQRRVDGPNPDLRLEENIVRYRLYWDEPRRYSLMSLPSIPGADIQYRKVFFTTHTHDVLDYAQLVSNTTLWDERVSVLAGVRYDTFDRVQRDPIQTATGAELLPPLPTSGHATTYSAGAVVYPLTKHRWLGAFFNYSENFTPVTPGMPRFDGQPFGPTRGAGYDYGLRLNLLRGRVYATLSRYESEQSDRVTGAPFGDIRGIWRAMGVPSSDPRFNIDFRDTESLTADGYEFEITANPTSNLRLTAGYSRPKTAIVDRLSDTKRYNAQYRAEWEAALANGTALDPTALRNALNNLDQALLTTVAGARLSGTLDYTANLYGTYTFTEGALNRFSIGAGAYFRGPEKIGNVDPRILFNTSAPTAEQRAASSFAYTYAPSYYNVSGHLAYEHKFGRYRAKFQLNVDNVLDDDEPRFYSVNTYNVGGIGTNPLVQSPGYFNYPDPRKYTLTVSVDF